MSISPSGTGRPARPPLSPRRRRAVSAPRGGMPTIAIGSSPFRSMISCAIRTSVRLRSSRSRTAWLKAACPFSASLDLVKGTDDSSLTPGRTGPFAMLLEAHRGGLPPFPVRHFDHVEVARHDRRLEHLARLLLDHRG